MSLTPGQATVTTPPADGFSTASGWTIQPCAPALTGEPCDLPVVVERVIRTQIDGHMENASHWPKPAHADTWRTSASGAPQGGPLAPFGPVDSARAALGLMRFHAAPRRQAPF